MNFVFQIPIRCSTYRTMKAKLFETLNSLFYAAIITSPMTLCIFIKLALDTSSFTYVILTLFSLILCVFLIVGVGVELSEIIKHNKFEIRCIEDDKP